MGISNNNMMGGTLNSDIIAPELVAKRISQIFDPNISPTAIPSERRRKAVKSAVNSGILVPILTISIPITFLGIFNSFANSIAESIVISAETNKIVSPIKKIKKS